MFMLFITTLPAEAGGGTPNASQMNFRFRDDSTALNTSGGLRIVSDSPLAKKAPRIQKILLHSLSTVLMQTV